MAHFQFPILQREVQGVLRRNLTFFFAFVFYALLCLVAVVFFGYLQWTSIERGNMGRGLFMLVVLFGYPCLGLYTAFYSSSVLVGEREKKTLDILLTSPVSGYSVILQKVWAPMLTAWLLVIGLMPILSLVFILGGVSPTEFLHQFVSMAIWISTCVMIGTAVSLKAKSSAKAVGLTLGILALLLVIPVFAFYYSMFPLFGPQREGPLLWAMAPIFWISPWGNGFLYTFDYNHSGILFLPNQYFSPPGMVNWILNILLQLLLFLRLSRIWNRAMEMKVKIPLATRLKRYPVFRVLLMPLLERKRKEFSPGHRALFDHQGRTLFTRTTRRILDLLTEGFLILSTAFLLVFVAMRDGGPIYGLFFLNTTVVGLFCLGVAMTSFARERDSDTSTLLLITPHSARRIFLEKWKYYLSFTGKMLIPAWGFPLLLWVLFTQGLYNAWETWELFRIAWRVAAFIPLVTLLAAYGGLVSRSGLTPVILGGILLGVGGTLVVGFISMLSTGSRAPYPMSIDLLTLTFIYQIIPLFLILLMSLFLIRGFDKSVKISRHSRQFMTIMGLNAIILASLDLLIAFDPDLGWLSREVRWVILPLTFATFLLWYMMNRPDRWWIERLTRGGV